MTDHDLSFDEFDETINPKPEENDFDRIIERAITRRGLLKSIMACGSVAAIGGMGAGAALWSGDAAAAKDRFAFSPIDANTLDDITVPEGYSSQIVTRWGDPLWSDGVDFDHGTRGDGASQEKSFGDNIDGMEVFAHGDKTLLVVNNEYTNRKIIWGNREEGKWASDDDVLKGKMAHGLTVVEIEEKDGQWSVVKDSPFNRRVTPDTEMALTGPAAGHDLMIDPVGHLSRLRRKLQRLFLSRRS